jgi:hypothetical protein
VRRLAWRPRRRSGEIIASELPHFVRKSVALVFGRRFAGTIAERCLRASAALWVDASLQDELTEPACLFAMLYLRHVAEDSDSWDETKERAAPRARSS